MSNFCSSWKLWDGSNNPVDTIGFTSAQIFCVSAPSTPYTVNVQAIGYSIPLAGVFNSSSAITVQNNISGVGLFTVSVANLPIVLTGGTGGVFLIRGIM